MIKKNDLVNFHLVDTLVFDMDYTIVRYITFNELIKQKKIILFPIIDELLALGFAMINDSKYFEKFYNKLTEVRKKLKINGELITSLVVKLLEPYIIPIENMPLTIKLLSSTYNIISFTDFSRETSKMELEKCGLSNVINNIYISESGVKKIQINAYEKLLQKLNKNPQNIVMIGNSIVDVHASKIGINTVLMDYNNKITTSNKAYLYASSVVTTATDLQLILQKK